MEVVIGLSNFGWDVTSTHVDELHVVTGMESVGMFVADLESVSYLRRVVVFGSLLYDLMLG